MQHLDADRSHLTMKVNPQPNTAGGMRADIRGLAALGAGACAISLAPVFVRLSDTGPTATAFYRLILAQPLLWVIVMSMERKSTNEPLAKGHLSGIRAMIPMFALAGVMFALDMGFWHTSIHLTTMANSTLIANSAPFFVIIGAKFLLKERIPQKFYYLFPLALIGMSMLARANLSTTGEALMGDLCALITAFFYGAYQLCVKHLRNSRIHPMIILAFSGIPAALILLTGALVFNERLVPENPASWWALLGLAWFSHIGGQGLIIYAFGHLPAGMASLGLLLQPVIVIFLGWILHDERMNGVQISGAVLLLTALYMASRKPASGN